MKIKLIFIRKIYIIFLKLTYNSAYFFVNFTDYV